MDKEIKFYLIDYKKDDIALIENSLENSGINNYKIIPESGENAVQSLIAMEDKVISGSPDLIILNLEPAEGKSNLELIKELKENESLRLIPLIVFTEINTQDQINSVYKSHANCFVHKPSEKEKLDQSLKELWNFWLETVRLPSAHRRRVKSPNSF